MQRKLPVWAVLSVVALILCQGFYATYLNRLYYETYAPFFDSMAYTNKMAYVLSEAKAHGFLAGMREAPKASTVWLPCQLACCLGDAGSLHL